MAPTAAPRNGPRPPPTSRKKQQVANIMVPSAWRTEPTRAKRPMQNAMPAPFTTVCPKAR